MTFARAIVRDFAAYLRTNISGIGQVLEEWPTANQELVYPAMSVQTAGTMGFRKMPAVEVSKGSVSDHKAQVTYHVGEYDGRLTVDIWTRYKPERDTYYGRLMDLLGDDLNNGFNLALPSYFDESANLTVVGYRYGDDMEAVQRQEWRVMVDLEVNCRAIRQKTDYIITQAPELIFSTPETIEKE